MNKKITANRFKPSAEAHPAAFHPDLGSGIDVCLKFIMMVAFLSILSLAAIFIHDFITQADFLNIRRIDVSGNMQASRSEIIELADLKRNRNIFELNLGLVEKKIATHPWIQSVTLKRGMSSRLTIRIVEHEALAIIRIGEHTDILINNQGRPFKVYDPRIDRLGNLPIVTGVALTRMNDEYGFAGALFESVMAFLSMADPGHFEHIQGDPNTGLTVLTRRFTSLPQDPDKAAIPVKLGFDDFKAKLKKARQISEYIDKHLPDTSICAMDLFNTEKVFIKTKLKDALHNNLTKGV